MASNLYGRRSERGDLIWLWSPVVLSSSRARARAGTAAIHAAARAAASFSLVLSPVVFFEFQMYVLQNNFQDLLYLFAVPSLTIGALGMGVCPNLAVAE